MSTKNELRKFLRSKGMNPEKIEYNNNLDVYSIRIGVEGTHDRFLRDVEMSGDEPTEQQVDFSMVKATLNEIQGSEIPSGTINIKETRHRNHFRLEVN